MKQLPAALIDASQRLGRDLNDLSRLSACIAANGLQRPVTVTPDRHLILGARRLAACQRLGWTAIDAVTVATVEEALTQFRGDAEGACCTLPLTIPDIISIDSVLRELPWSPGGGSAQATQGTSHKPRREEIVRALGLNRKQFSQARHLVLAAHGFRDTRGTFHPVPPSTREHATSVLAGVAEPGDLNAAWRTFQRLEFATINGGAPAPRPSRSKGRKLPTRRQDIAVNSALAALHGIIAGLSQVDAISGDIPHDTITQWEAETTAAIRALSQFRTLLRTPGAPACPQPQ